MYSNSRTLSAALGPKLKTKQKNAMKKLSNNFSLEPLDFSSFHFRSYTRSDDGDDDGSEEFFVHLHFRDVEGAQNRRRHHTHTYIWTCKPETPVDSRV